MKSREALTICKELYADKNASLKSAKEGQDRCEEDLKHIWNDDIDYLQSQVDFYERIIQDLEVLEILKKYYKNDALWSNSAVIEFWGMPEEQLKKVKEGLDNDK